MENKLEKQIRTLGLKNVRAAGNSESNDMVVEGYASVFDKATVICEYDGIEYKEIIDRNAFNNADFSMCCMKYNHSDNNLPLARVRGGSLTLSLDDFGLKFNAKFFNTSFARDLYNVVKVDGLDKCSFAFTVNREEYDCDTRTRKILEIDKVFDVSIVDVPAYDETSVVAVRDFFKAEAEKTKSLESDGLKRKRALALTYL